jgi:hypothetical protein
LLQGRARKVRIGTWAKRVGSMKGRRQVRLSAMLDLKASFQQEM